MEIHKLFSNRSACFCGLGDYARALSDAENAIRHSPKVVARVLVYVSVHACIYVSGFYDCKSLICIQLGIHANANTFAFYSGVKDTVERGRRLRAWAIHLLPLMRTDRSLSLSLSLSLSAQALPLLNALLSLAPRHLPPRPSDHHEIE